MDTRLVGLGAMFMFVSSMVAMQLDGTAEQLPLAIVAIVSLGLASGSFVLNTTGNEST